MNGFWIGATSGFLIGAVLMAIAGFYRLSRLQTTMASAQQRLIETAEGRLGDAFASLSLTALRDAKHDFLELASTTLEAAKEQVNGSLRLGEKGMQDLVRPIKEALEKLAEHSTSIEQRRTSAYDGIKQHIEGLLSETTKLSNALRNPSVRGSWGELTLRTVCENAGLIQGEHFVLQDTTEGDEGPLRPDMVIKLPRGRVIIVDAKTPMDSFREAMAAEDETTRSTKLKAHAKHVRDHVKKLSNKAYWSRYSGSPDCTVLFMPTEAAYFAAMEADPDLVREAAVSRVLIANPMTLVGLMRAVAHVLDDERLRESAEEVKDLGRKLYDSLRACLLGVSKVGRNIRLSADSYNDLVGSIDRSLMPRARRLRQLGSGAGMEVVLPDQCETQVRQPLSLTQDAEDLLSVQPNGSA